MYHGYVIFEHCYYSGYIIQCCLFIAKLVPLTLDRVASVRCHGDHYERTSEVWYEWTSLYYITSLFNNASNQGYIVLVVCLLDRIVHSSLREHRSYSSSSLVACHQFLCQVLIVHRSPVITNYLPLSTFWKKNCNFFWCPSLFYSRNRSSFNFGNYVWPERVLKNVSRFVFVYKGQCHLVECQFRFLYVMSFIRVKLIILLCFFIIFMKVYLV